MCMQNLHANIVTLVELVGGDTLSIYFGQDIDLQIIYFVLKYPALLL